MVRNGQFLRDGKASHSPCIWMSARPIHGVAFLSCWFTLKGVCCCSEKIWSKRTRVFEDDVFIENTRLVGGSKTQDLNLRADLVLNMSRCSPGQWFPETEYWASAIFVGTSGIPPKIIYRSVKSYNISYVIIELILLNQLPVVIEFYFKSTQSFDYFFWVKIYNLFFQECI